MITLCVVNTQPVSAEPKTIVVPDDYPTIQEAIDNADEGDTVFVKSGTYYNQTLIINKSLSLIGEDSKTTVLIGTVVTFVSFVTVIQINANDVKISGFTITNTWYCIAGNGDRTQIIGNILTTTYDYGFGTGIAVHGSYKTIAENIITGGVVGIQGSGSYNTITGNTITDTGDRSIELYGSFNTVTGNNIRDHVGMGIQIYSGDSNTITKNNITDGSNGINIHNGSRNTVSENRVTGMAGSGISIAMGFDNTIYRNYIANNKWGAIIGGYEFEAGNNTVYHNNFIDNTVQVRTDWTVYGVNHWDNGYPSGGNYWSDYQYRYPNATEIDGSSIWDTPYVIDANNQDRYPLMSPVVISDYPDEENESMPTPEPFPTTWILAAAVAIIVIIAVAAVILKKRGK
jgi:parallel beta-helix repeat protein